MSNSFWDFPAWCKYDELIEHRHMHLITGALSSAETGIERVDMDEYILFGPTEALLFRPKNVVSRLALGLYCAMLSLLSPLKY